MITVSNLDIYPLDLLSANGAHHEEGQLRSEVLRFLGLTPDNLCELKDGSVCRELYRSVYCFHLVRSHLQDTITTTLLSMVSAPSALHGAKGAFFYSSVMSSQSASLN